MDDPRNERVLVVPTELFHRLGHFQGFCHQVERYLDVLMRPDSGRYRLRDEVERDPGFKQLIPYVIFRHVDATGQQTIFQYTRGTGQGEGRLHRKRSVGVGGHISLCDASAQTSGPAYEEGMRRELDEEVVVETPCTMRCVGLINDDHTDVGSVHLGVVHLCDVEQPRVRPRETEMLEAGFRPIAEILADLSGFETWSQICLPALFGSAEVREHPRQAHPGEPRIHQRARADRPTRR